MSMPMTLLELAVENLHENINQYNREELRRILVPFHNIKVMLRESFYRKSHEHCSAGSQCNDRLLAALPLWMKYCHSNTLLTCELPTCNKSRLSTSIFRELVRCLPLITPNLTKIFFPAFDEWNISLGDIEVDAIARLSQLKNLEINNVSIPLAGFIKILELCENLETIAAAITNIEVEGQMQLIWDSFVYCDTNWCDLQRGRLTLSLSKTLLEEEEELEENEYRKVMNLQRIFWLTLTPINIAEMQDLLKMEMHTHVTHLNVYCYWLKDGDTLDQFPRFPQVKLAHFYLDSRTPDLSLRQHQVDGSSNVLRSFLRCNGQSLLHLKISNLASGQLSLEQLFGWCPNLKTLFLLNCSIHSGNNVPIEHLSKLEEVNWTGQIEGTAPLGIILSAPLLEELNFWVYAPCVLDFGDSEDLICSIAQRKILRSLKFFCFGNISCATEECDSDEIFYEHFITAIKTLCNIKNVTDFEQIFLPWL